MKLNKIIVAMGAVMAMCAGAAYAGADDPVTPATTTTATGGTIHFKGSLVDAPCAVSTDSDGQTVTLGQYTVHHFDKTGTLGTAKPFDIKLEDCDTSTASTAAIAFAGRADAANPSLLAVDSGLSGGNDATASGIGIQILDEKSKAVPVDGATLSTAHTLVNGENVLHFAAQYESTADTVTAGDANADATFTIQYN